MGRLEGDEGLLLQRQRFQQLPALRELARVCKPDGEIRLLEYVTSQNSRKRRIMRLWAPWVRWAYGASFDRHTERYMPAAGLEIVEERFLFEDIIKAGTGIKFHHDHNHDWTKHTRPIIEAFFHAHHVLTMMVKYGEELDDAPQMLPSGWATV
ncbi:MAG: hypothetical protein IIC21_10665, partial [Chloroflexi bacterium]|nr:hypothetical protein [Chloroflexota bacterium]